MKELLTSILWMSHKSREGHVPSSLSILDIVWVLYTKVLKYDSAHPLNPNRDRFILSKGHASLALYVVLSKVGYFSKDKLEHFAEYESILGGHPDRLKVPGIEASTGSLGHGLPQAVGVALALKIKGNSQRVFVLIGDGEANEGTIWESALLASHHKLNNLVCILDFNHSTDRALEIGDMNTKFRSFGWNVKEIDGHDHRQIEIASQLKSTNQPQLIIAHTIKGKGLKTMENNPEWHHKIPTENEVISLLEEM